MSPRAAPAPRLAAADRIADSAAVRHRDYVLADYEPLAPPEGRLHPASLLRAALRAEGCLDGGWPLVEALASAVGRDETVWGVKYAPGGFSWELYFYNRDANAGAGRHPKSVSSLAAVLSRSVAVAGVCDEGLPYFMCSVDLDAAVLARRRPAVFRVYLETGEPAAEGGGAGFSYSVGPGGACRLENHYSFFDMRSPRGLESLRARLRFSPRSGDAASRDRLLDGDLLGCRRACYAVKPAHDALYFSRVPTARAARFLSAHPRAAAGALLAAHAEDFAHLLWDIGVDFRSEGARAEIEKIGVYGFL